MKTPQFVCLVPYHRNAKTVPLGPSLNNIFPRADIVTERTRPVRGERMGRSALTEGAHNVGSPEGDGGGRSARIRSSASSRFWDSLSAAETSESPTCR